jgi:hypothetical protein
VQYEDITLIANLGDPLRNFYYYGLYLQAPLTVNVDRVSWMKQIRCGPVGDTPQGI